MPLAHAVQCAPLVFTVPTSPFRPAAQPLQTVTPAALYCPSAQSLQLIDPTASVLNVPARHVSHCTADSLSANLPPSHCWHVAALAPLYLPDGQASHVVRPGALWCRPAPHASQYVVP